MMGPAETQDEGRIEGESSWATLHTINSGHMVQGLVCPRQILVGFSEFNTFRLFGQPACQVTRRNLALRTHLGWQAQASLCAAATSSWRMPHSPTVWLAPHWLFSAESCFSNARMLARRAFTLAS